MLRTGKGALKPGPPADVPQALPEVLRLEVDGRALAEQLLDDSFRCINTVSGEHVVIMLTICEQLCNYVCRNKNDAN